MFRSAAAMSLSRTAATMPPRSHARATSLLVNISFVSVPSLSPFDVRAGVGVHSGEDITVLTLVRTHAPIARNPQSSSPSSGVYSKARLHTGCAWVNATVAPALSEGTTVPELITPRSGTNGTPRPCVPTGRSITPTPSGSGPTTDASNLPSVSPRLHDSHSHFTKENTDPVATVPRGLGTIVVAAVAASSLISFSFASLLNMLLSLKSATVTHPHWFTYGDSPPALKPKPASNSPPIAAPKNGRQRQRVSPLNSSLRSSPVPHLGHVPSSAMKNR